MQIPKIRGRALVVGAVLVVTTTLAPACSGVSAPEHSAANTPESEPAPWVLFQQDGGERTEVAMIRTDGTGRTAPLADLAGGDQTNPDWSPDGKRIVFAMSDGERDDLWVADADGGDAHRLLDCDGTCRWLDDPDWSPDGKQIVYSRSIQRADGWGIGTLETVDVASGDVTVVLGPWKRYFTAGARYSPDGREVVFEKVRKTGRPPDSGVRAVTLVVAGLDQPGHPVRTLTDPRVFAATADWSPDGEGIVYTALVEPDADAQELFWISPRGGAPAGLTHVSDDGGYAVEPAWLPDGTGLVFSGLLDGGGASPELLSVRLDGSGLGPAFGDETVFGRHPRVQPAA